MKQMAKRLGRGDLAEIKEDLVPQTRIQQVQNRVFGPADVKVNAFIAHPVFFRISRNKAIRVPGVAETQVVPA